MVSMHCFQHELSFGRQETKKAACYTEATCINKQNEVTGYSCWFDE